jgi:hypothetical protein
MAMAMIYPEPEKRGGRTDRGQSSKKEYRFPISAGKLSEARTVLKYLPELAKAVLVGPKPLSTAYEEAIAERDTRNSDENKLAKTVLACGVWCGGTFWKNGRFG